MEQINIKKLCDKKWNENIYVFYETGKFKTPLFILNEHETKCLVNDIKKTVNE